MNFTSGSERKLCDKKLISSSAVIATYFLFIVACTKKEKDKVNKSYNELRDYFGPDHFVAI